MTLKPKVLRSEEQRELAWLGHLFVRGVFDGEHRLRVEPLQAGHSRFIQSETFRGLLVPMTGGVLKKTLRGFEEMNAALKRRAEARPA